MSVTKKLINEVLSLPVEEPVHIAHSISAKSFFAVMSLQ